MPAKKKKPMTPKEFVAEMNRITVQKAHDTESMHGDMDYLLVQVLRSLGYKKGCDVFDAAKKWYA